MAKMNMRKAYGEALLALGRENKDVVAPRSRPGQEHHVQHVRQ